MLLCVSLCMEPENEDVQNTHEAVSYNTEQMLFCESRCKDPEQQSSRPVIIANQA
jgi:hypothetical protein